MNLLTSMTIKNFFKLQFTIYVVMPLWNISGGNITLRSETIPCRKFPRQKIEIPSSRK